MKDKFEKATERLLTELDSNATTANDALKYSQAVLNLAHAEQVMGETKFQVQNAKRIG